MEEQINNSKSTVNKNLFEQIKCDIVEKFDDIFDIIDENFDALEYTTEELNRYYQTGHLNYILQEEEIIDNDCFKDCNQTISLQVDHQQQRKRNDSEEFILSQKLSQLSVENKCEIVSSSSNKRRHTLNTVSSSIVKKKKMETSNDSDVYYNDDDDDDDNDNDDNEGDDEDITDQEHIPTYLSSRNQLFIRLAESITTSVSTLNMNDIQQIALLMHRIAEIEIKRLVTKVYFKSVTGTLTEPDCTLAEIDRRVWPLQVKSLMLTYKNSTGTTTTEPILENEQALCESLLQEQIKQMRQQIEHYLKELVDKKNSLIGFTSSIEEHIHNYVQQYGIKPLKMKRDFKIAFIEYNYETEIIQREYAYEKPNEYQIQVAKRLVDTRRELEKSKRELLELKQRVFFNKTLKSLNSSQLADSNVYNERVILNRNVREQFLNQEEKMNEYKILDSMAIRIRTVETIFYRSQHIFDYELAKMWENHRNLVKNQGMPMGLSSLIERNLANISNHWREIYNYRIDYNLRNSYDIDSNDNTSMIKANHLSFNMIIDTTHPLTYEQIQLLNRGPSYVPICQMYISSTYPSIDDIVKQQYAPLKHQLASLFLKYHINLALSMEIQRKLFDKFNHLFSISIPSNLQQRALNEKNLIQSIRTSLNENNLILRRTADNRNTFYLGNNQDFETKANEYLTKSDAYKLVISIDNNDINKEQQISKQLNEIVTTINDLLQKLREYKSLDKKTIDSFLLDSNKIKLPYLYFLPDVSRGKDISLLPFISAQNSATWKIGNFLNHLIRPVVEETLKSTTFRDEIDFIQKLNNYVHVEHRLRPTTLFGTITITNFYTLDVHERILNKVVFFLQDSLLSNKLGRISIMTIKNLLFLVLNNNVFQYKNKIYKIEKGSPHTMPLTETLSNIYLYLWQTRLLTHLTSSVEVFGRYKNQIFFTWNKTNALELETFLQEEVLEKDLNVRFHMSIGTSVNYLNTYVENRQGQFYSRIYHDSNIQSYTLPYVTTHSKLAYSDWLRTALIRAICCSSSIEDFHQERVYLELTCLMNGLSLIFVETHVQHFFDFFHAPNMRYSMNQISYEHCRRKWFDYTQMQYELTDELQKFDDQGHLIHLNYIYEMGPRCQFNKEFHHLWFDYFKNHPHLSKDKMKILLKPKHYHTLNTLLGKEETSISIQGDK